MFLVAANPNEYGAGGKGGGTGYIGTSGAGGGRSAIYVNEKEVSTAGGGGHFGGKGGLNGFDYNFLDLIEKDLIEGQQNKRGRHSEGGSFGGSYNFTFDQNNDGKMDVGFDATTRCISNEDGSEKICNPMAQAQAEKMYQHGGTQGRQMRMGKLIFTMKGKFGTQFRFL